MPQGRDGNDKDNLPALRLPPQNLDAEKGVLGSIFWEPTLLDELVQWFAPAHMYRSNHATLYAKMLELRGRGEPVDVITIVNSFGKEAYANLGGDDFIREIMDSTPHSANGLHYAHIVVQKAKIRDLIAVYNTGLADAYASDLNAEEQLEKAEAGLFAVRGTNRGEYSIEGYDAIAGALDRVEYRKGGRSGLTVGLPEFDFLTDGFQPEQVVILAGRPSMGKTALALNWADYISVTLGRSVGYISLEMGRLEVGERLVVTKAVVDNYRLKDPDTLSFVDVAALSDAYAAFRDVPLIINDSPALNMMQIGALARQWRRERTLEVLFIDYLQLVDPPQGERASRQEQIAGISRAMKTLARELKISVIALSQLNRNVENREDKTPRMADLRESGAIEQDADLVCLLHRPEYYDHADRPGMAKLFVAKNRNGKEGTVELRFRRKYTRFETWSDVDPDGPPEQAQAF